jgi:rusticyanin
MTRRTAFRIGGAFLVFGVAGLVWWGARVGPMFGGGWRDMAALMPGMTGFGGMMGGGMMGSDPGKAMGSAMVNAPGPRIPAAQAESLGAAAPAGATVDRAANRVVFTTKTVQFAVLGSPPTGRDMTFQIAGLADPTVVVPAGSTVTVRFINADHDEAHGWLLTPARPPFPYMAMMGAPVAFPGAVARPLGDPNAAGMPEESITFRASAGGQYTYLCPVPGHAQQGMFGTFQVGSA